MDARERAYGDIRLRLLTYRAVARSLRPHPSGQLRGEAGSSPGSRFSAL